MITDAQREFLAPGNLLRLVWARKALIFGTSLAGILVALLMAATTTPLYQAFMIIGPPDSMSSSTGNSVLNQLGQFTGIQVESPEESQTQMYRLLLGGTRVAAEMENRYHLLEQMLPDAWNADEKRWKERNEVRLGLIANSKEMLGLLHWGKPTVTDLAGLLSSKIVFTQLPKSSFFRVAYTTPNPQQGVQLLSQLNDAANHVYSQGLADETQEQINYIDQMLRTETRQNVRDAQTRQLDLYSNRLVALHSGQSLLAQIVQPPVVSSTPVWPRPSLMLLLGAVIGFLAGLVAAVFWPKGLSRAAANWTHLVNAGRGAK